MEKTRLEQLQFNLKKKEEEMKEYNLNVFTFNRNIEILAQEISDIKKEIKLLEETKQ